MFLLTIHSKNGPIEFALIFESALTLQAIFPQEKLKSVLSTFGLKETAVIFGESFLDNLEEQDRSYIKSIKVERHQSGYILTIIFESTEELSLDLPSKVIHLNDQIAIDLTEMLVLTFGSDLDDKLTFSVSASYLIQNNCKLSIISVNL